MNRWKKSLTLIVAAAILSAVAAIATGLKSPESSDQESNAGSGHSAEQAAPPPTVTFVEATPRDLAIKYDRLGVVEPSRTAEVRARVQGYLAKRLFKEGDTVQVGDLLYQIEKDMFEAEVQGREADLKDAEARNRLAERDLLRTKNLRESNAVSEEKLDQAEMERDRSAAMVERAQAALREARLDLGYTDIRAPVSGVIGKTMQDKGDLVSVNSHLVTITTISPIYVSYGVSEVDYFRLREDDEFDMTENVNFTIILQNGEVFGESGEMNFQSTQFEPGTGMLRVRLEYPNESALLRPNLFVKIIEDHGLRPNVITVPKRSVIQSPMGPAVFVIDSSDTLQFRPVEMGAWRGDEWEVASGLNPGERVMVDGLLSAKPGSPVTAEPLRDGKPGYAVGAAPLGAPAMEGGHEEHRADTDAETPEAAK